MSVNMTEEELRGHAKDLAQKLEGKASEEVLLKELEKYVFQYQIGINSARNGILKKYSAPRSTAQVSSAGVTKKIAELTGDEMNVNIVAKMVFVEKKTINTKNGERTIWSGLINDGGDSASFTIWSEEGNYEKGSVYTFKSAYCKKFRDQVQVHIGTRGKVEPSDVVIETGKSASATGEPMKIADITEKTVAATITGKVISVDTRIVNVKGTEKTVWGGTIDDGTGKIQFSAWEDCGLVAGNVYTVSNANIRSWRGIPQLNINSAANVAASSAVIEIKETSNLRTVEEVTRTGGGIDISITGTIVDVKSGSGLIKRCPECRRALLNGMCSIHGLQENGISDLRLKTTVDDGTGAISVIIGCRETEALTGITLAQADAEAKDLGDASFIANRMAAAVLLRRVTVNGNVMSDEKFGPQMNARSLSPVTVDIKAEAESLLSEVEGVL